MAPFRPPPPPPPPFARSRAEQQLGNLAIAYYVLGGITIPFSLIFLVHVGLGAAMLGGSLDGGGGPPPPDIVGWIFMGAGAFGVLVGVTMGALTIYVGRCLAQRKHLLFVYIMAGLLCASFPLGTVVGVLTFMALANDDTKSLFHKQA